MSYIFFIIAEVGNLDIGFKITLDFVFILIKNI